MTRFLTVADRKHRTWAQVIAEAQFEAARKGSTVAAREIADRLEGKVSSRPLLLSEEGQIEDGGPVPLPAGLDAYQRFQELTRVLREHTDRRLANQRLAEGLDPVADRLDGPVPKKLAAQKADRFQAR